MNPQPLISIVLPTHNGAQYLREALSSCLAQSDSDWELIVVDDGSTDETPAIIAHFAATDPRFRPLRNPTARRLPGALNVGFAQARGEYLSWTSDDNLYRPEAFARMRRFLEAHPGVDVVYADYTVIDEEGRLVRTVTTPDRSHLLYGNCVGACFLYRRRVHEGTGPYAEDLFLAEDYDYWLRVAARFTLAPLHEDLYLYRAHQASLTVQQQPKVQLAAEQAVFRNLPRLSWADASQRVWTYRRIAAQARSRGQYGLAMRYYLAALPHVPGFVLADWVRLPRRSAASPPSLP